MPQAVSLPPLDLLDASAESAPLAGLPPLDLPPLDLRDLLPPITLLSGSPGGTFVTSRVAQPIAGSPDWFLVPWDEVEARTGLSPRTLPGVRTAANHPVETLAPPHAAEFRKQAGASAKAPRPYKVHRSHLPVIGWEAPAGDVSALGSLDEARRVLRPYQLAAVEFIRARRGTLLADAQRLGKSPTLAYAHDPAWGPMIIAGPVAARAIHHEWAARRFGACLDVHEGRSCSTCARVGADKRLSGPPSFAALEGRAPDITILKRNVQVYFLTFAVLPAWSEHFMSFGRIGTLVADEVHMLGIQNRRNISVIAFKRLNVGAHRTVCASGTPMWSMPSGLWPIVDTLCPAAFGDYWPFCVRYANGRPGAHGWIADGSANEEELEKRLSAVMLRRTWQDIKSDLPPIVRSTEYIPLTDADHAMIYETANELRRAANTGAPQTVVGNLERLRKLYAGVKVTRAVEWIREEMAAGRSVIAWTLHRDVARAISDALGTETMVFGPIHGQLTAKAREQILDEVRATSAPRVLIATMGSLATAVSLNWADAQAFVELDWTPAVISQAESRPYDGTKPIPTVFFIADCDPDRRQGEVLIAKLDANGSLGLRAGGGDVAQAIAGVFSITAGSTLDDIAALIMADETL